jgi:D-xylose transport system permease protein
MFVFFLALVLGMHYVLTRTSFGRSLFAIGGNPEAARRAGLCRFSRTFSQIARHCHVD